MPINAQHDIKVKKIEGLMMFSQYCRSHLLHGLSVRATKCYGLLPKHYPSLAIADYLLKWCIDQGAVVWKKLGQLVVFTVKKGEGSEMDAGLLSFRKSTVVL